MRSPAAVGPRITRVAAAAYAIPTDSPESDGTLEWDRTTLVLVSVEADGRRGFGYTYGDAAAAVFVSEHLARAVAELDAFDIPAAHRAMRTVSRNQGRHGVGAVAMSAVDVALWDLKGRLLDLPVSVLLGRARESVEVYGSGGFTSYTPRRLEAQLRGWAADGMRAVKMKVGREPERDPERVRLARRAIGPDVNLFVDANGAYERKQALGLARRFAEHGVAWFEEPVPGDDLDGLRLLRDCGPPGMAIAAGEYGYAPDQFREWLEHKTVDVLQADASRCGGITGFLRAAAMAEAFGVPISSHTAPSLHAAVCCAAPGVKNLEWFHDHVRIETRYFEGAPRPRGGRLSPDRSAPGLGFEPKRADLERFAAHG